MLDWLANVLSLQNVDIRSYQRREVLEILDVSQQRRSMLVTCSVPPNGTSFWISGMQISCITPGLSLQASITNSICQVPLL